MNSYEQLKLAIYESDLDFEESCNVVGVLENCSEEDFDFVVDSIKQFLESGVEDNLFLEMKTREEYRTKKFEKRYNYQKDKDDPERGTITVDGETYKVRKKHPLTRDDRNFYADPDNGELILGKNIHKLKNSKREAAFLQHEIGHLKLMSTSKNNPHADRSKINKRIVNRIIDASVHDTSGQYKVSGLDSETVKTLTRELRRIKKNQAKVARRELPPVKEDKAKTASRERALNQLKKHETNLSHLNTNEFEADQYSANKVGGHHLRRGIREAYKLANKDHEKDFKRTMRDVRNGYKMMGLSAEKINGIVKDVEAQHAKGKKLMHKNQQADYKGRSKALRDKSISRKDRDVYN